MLLRYTCNRMEEIVLQYLSGNKGEANKDILEIHTIHNIGVEELDRAIQLYKKHGVNGLTIRGFQRRSFSRPIFQ